MDTVVSGGQGDFAAKHVERGGYAYDKRIVVPKDGSQLHVSFMEIPPGKSAFPYHWHGGITEAFVILSGTGRVRTPERETDLAAGQVIVFPPGPAGAHRITNTSDTEPLRYVDLDTVSDPDVVHYPDSGKTGARSGGVFRVWHDDAEVDYYEGDPDA